MQANHGKALKIPFELEVHASIFNLDRVLLWTVLISVLDHDAMLELIALASAKLRTLPRIHVIRPSSLHLLVQPIMVLIVLW